MEEQRFNQEELGEEMEGVFENFKNSNGIAIGLCTKMQHVILKAEDTKDAINNIFDFDRTVERAGGARIFYERGARKLEGKYLEINGDYIISDKDSYEARSHGTPYGVKKEVENYRNLGGSIIEEQHTEEQIERE